MEQDTTYTIKLTHEQCEFLVQAIDGYEYITTDVLTYGETYHRRKEIIDPIYAQMPEDVF